MRNILMTTLALVGLALFTLSGCGKAPAPAGEGEAGHEHAEHDHEAMGPHDGHIIELGADAELTHDEAAHKVGIYLLGGDAKTAKPIPVTEVKIKVSADGAFSEYVLPAVPQAGEEGGQSSYFEVVSEPLCEVVCGESEAENTQARLSFDMDGKPFVGMIETAAHEHDHEHGHAH